VLRWLPEDTQTVVVARGPFKFEVPDPDQDVAELGLDRGIRLMTTGLLRDVRGGVAEPLRDRSASLAVEGGRRFRRPKDRGLMPYEGAQVIIFQDDLGSRKAVSRPDSSVSW
jgi:hypothetical protein